MKILFLTSSLLIHWAVLPYWVSFCFYSWSLFLRYFFALVGGPKSKDFTPISWKTKQDKILSSHYNLHFGHCIQLDISPLSSQKNGKYLMGKGIHFVHMRVNVKTDQNLDQLFPSLFFHNGTDVDRLGENILGRELSSGKHDVII